MCLALTPFLTPLLDGLDGSPFSRAVMRCAERFAEDSTGLSAINTIIIDINVGMFNEKVENRPPQLSGLIYETAKRAPYPALRPEGPLSACRPYCGLYFLGYDVRTIDSNDMDRQSMGRYSYVVVETTISWEATS